MKTRFSVGLLVALIAVSLSPETSWAGASADFFKNASVGNTRLVKPDGSETFATFFVTRDLDDKSILSIKLCGSIFNECQQYSKELNPGEFWWTWDRSEVTTTVEGLGEIDIEFARFLYNTGAWDVEGDKTRTYELMVARDDQGGSAAEAGISLGGQVGEWTTSWGFGGGAHGYFVDLVQVSI